MTATEVTLLQAQAWQVASGIVDPELGSVTIGELGLVRSVTVDENRNVEVVLTPTFLGCPALSLIAADVCRVLKTLDVSEVAVRFVASPVWSPSQINEQGRAKLVELGIGVAAADGSVRCPYCGGGKLASRVPVGSTSCRSVSWCSECRTVVDVMRASLER